MHLPLAYAFSNEDSLRENLWAIFVLSLTEARKAQDRPDNAAPSHSSLRLKPSPVVSADIPRAHGVTELVAVVHVPDAMIRVVPSAPWTPSYKPLSLYLAQLARRRIPAASTVVDRRGRALLILQVAAMVVPEVVRTERTLALTPNINESPAAGTSNRVSFIILPFQVLPFPMDKSGRHPSHRCSYKPTLPKDVAPFKNATPRSLLQIRSDKEGHELQPSVKSW